MEIISKEHVHFSFTKSRKPALSVWSGQTVCFETCDCFYNQLLPDGADITKIDASRSNAVTGPLYVEDAYPGDTLKVEILDIRTGPVGVCASFPNTAWDNGILKEKYFRRFPVRDGMAEFNSSIKIPVMPMIGVIGTAPREEEVSTMTPMDHGGNMDCTQIKTGTTLYLPVYVHGALLSMGDLHAVMGDGEVCGCGLEIEGAVTVRVTALKDCPLIWPAAVTDNRFIVIASADSVENAWKLATARMEALVSSQTGLSHEDASILLSLCGDLAVCQTVNPLKTVRMEIPVNIFSTDNGSLCAKESTGLASPP